MKLTKTQKNFRKQMEKINRKDNPYDNSRSGNPFDNITPQKSSGVLFILIIVLGFSYVVIKGKTSNVTPTSVHVNNSSTQNIGKTAVPITEAIFLDQLKAIRSAVNEKAQKVQEQHQIPPNQRNYNTYKAVLLDGIFLLDKESNLINDIKPPDQLKPLFSIEKDHIDNLNEAYKNYLEYVDTRNTAFNDIGNQYLNLANQKGQDSFSAFIDYLNKHNYNYSIHDNTVTYSVQN